MCGSPRENKSMAVSCCMLYAVCCMLYAVCCMLYAVCCVLLLLLLLLLLTRWLLCSHATLLLYCTVNDYGPLAHIQPTTAKLAIVHHHHCDSDRLAATASHVRQHRP